MSLLETMITFGGSPIAVAVPPMLENITSAIKIFFGSKFNTSQSLQRNIDIYVHVFVYCKHLMSDSKLREVLFKLNTFLCVLLLLFFALKGTNLYILFEW